MQENTSPIYTEFLPISRADMEARGWDQLDFVVVGGDAYVDHPSFGTAIISRLLEAEGYKVGVLAQPRYSDCEDFKRFGRPKYGFFIGGGNVDSMVSHYSVAKIPRAEDEYSPGGIGGARPDRSATVYTRLAKEAYPDLPVILGGLEASLRRFAHYDYWLDTVLPSIAEDSGADLISFGMGEHQTVEIARRLAAGEPVESITDVDGTCYRSKTLLYDRGGNDLKVYSGEKELFSQNYAKSIYCAELSSSGSLAVATRSDTHTSQVTVYNDKFASIYEWYSAEGYVLDLCLPASGKVLAAATLEAQDGQLVSSVNLLDLTRKQETRRLDFTGEIIVDMAVSGGDQNLYVLTDKKFYEISLSAATVLNTYDFSAQGLWYYHFDEGIFTLVTGNYVEERSLNVVRLTPGFAEPRYAACTDHFIDVRSDSGHTYVLTDNELHVYDAQMQPEAVYDTPDASSLELIGDDVYYLTGSSLEKLSHQQQKEEE